jgi:hypothetical protein
VFPNSQDALPLPRRPDIERYKKLAKDLVNACKSADPDAIGGWAEAWVAIPRRTKQVEAFARRELLNEKRRHCRLSDAQFVIARSHDFETWTKFTQHLKKLVQKSSVVAKFEAAADAICDSNVKTLEHLV